MADMRLIVAGAGGRMGRTLIHAIAATPGVALAGAIEAKGAAVIGRDAGELAGLGPNGVKVTTDLAPLLREADALIDFTVPAATRVFLEQTAGRVHIIGTTGLSGEDEALITQAARRSVVVKSGNMSLGVNLLAALVKRVAKTLDEDFDIEILEMHHNKKIDAPSGTALMLGRAAAEGRGVDLVQRSVRNEDRMTMFAVMEGFFAVGLLAGSLVGPALVSAFGDRGSLVVAGAILPALAVLTARPIARRTRRSPMLEQRIALLRRNPLFSPLPLTALDRLPPRGAVVIALPMKIKGGSGAPRQHRSSHRLSVVAEVGRPAAYERHARSGHPLQGAPFGEVPGHDEAVHPDVARDEPLDVLVVEQVGGDRLQPPPLTPVVPHAHEMRWARALLFA